MRICSQPYAWHGREDIMKLTNSYVTSTSMHKPQAQPSSRAQRSDLRMSLHKQCRKGLLRIRVVLWRLHSGRPTDAGPTLDRCLLESDIPLLAVDAVDDSTDKCDFPVWLWASRASERLRETCSRQLRSTSTSNHGKRLRLQLRTDTDSTDAVMSSSPAHDCMLLAEISN